MSPESAPLRQFGRTPGDSARGAAVLAVLGALLVGAVTNAAARPNSPLAPLLASAGIAEPALFGLGAAGVVGLAVYGFIRAVRTAEVFTITREGLHVAGPFGRYLLAWDNIASAEDAGGGGLGINVWDRALVLESHVGGPRQREWLRTLEPFGRWDFLYPRAELGCSVEDVLDALRPYLQAD